MSARTSDSCSADDRLLIVSLHDVAPHTQRRFDEFIARLKALGVPRVSLLVVPRWHGLHPITETQEFVGWLQQRAAEGHDICMHGLNHHAADTAFRPVEWFMHRVYTDREDEFFRITGSEAPGMLCDALALFRDAGLTVYGFTPPAWLISSEGRVALAKVGLFYNTGRGHVDLLQEDRRIRAPTLVFSSRSLWRRVVSGIWVPLWARLNAGKRVLRIAVHPADLAHARVEERLAHMIENAVRTRRSCTYRDLLASRAAGAGAGA